jgi:hypothetical protein
MPIAPDHVISWTQCMDIEAIRAELADALDHTAPAEHRVRAARNLLIKRGIEAFHVQPRPGIGLDEVLRIASGAPASEARREFAVLLVFAIGIDGMLPTRGETERHIRSFLEQALLNPLRRANYPFGGSPYDKRHVLAGLHATIEEHLRPLELTMPSWIHGGVRRTEG